ncbi:DUF3231 family protein [Salirhabdus salicampi]|uniref:DUF3231 family protein n=1 Tax=Salirhabdus salicampi TaxID=476102 RepID=UPI0020C50430|nr:DUF3231 family protein [Salirhabdus salicampi]MCP8615867.1 DUF3231 family protein [Salirhabdus salicampi]
METEHNIRLTSAELSSLWTTYLADTISICIFEYFLAKVDDTEIKPILEHALKLSKDHVDIIEKIFTEEGIPIPRGFTDEDVNPKAPRLFQDTLFLNFVKHMAKGGLATYGYILPLTVRKDIREFYSSCLASTTELYNEATSLLLSKGIELRPPYIPYHKEVDFVGKQRFMAGWFSDKRPLTGQEIMNLFANFQTNSIGTAIITGYTQVARSKKLREFFHRGKELAKKQMEIFEQYLSQNDLPVPMTWDHMVSQETEPPFSDKLMLYHVGVMNTSGIGNYGTSISMSQRRDITVAYTRLMGEIGLFAEDGLQLLIENKWLERPPQTIDRDKLI